MSNRSDLQLWGWEIRKEDSKKDLELNWSSGRRLLSAVASSTLQEAPQSHSQSKTSTQVSEGEGGLVLKMQALLACDLC